MRIDAVRLIILIMLDAMDVLPDGPGRKRSEAQGHCPIHNLHHIMTAADCHWSKVLILHSKVLYILQGGILVVEPHTMCFRNFPNTVGLATLAMK